MGQISVAIPQNTLPPDSPHPSKHQTNNLNITDVLIFYHYRHQVTFVSIEFLPVVTPTEEELLDPRLFSDRVSAFFFIDTSAFVSLSRIILAS